MTVELLRELSIQGVLIYLCISLSQFIHHPIPAVRDVIYIGPVENTLPSPNPVWLTVKV